MVEQIPCPVCTLFLHPGMSLEDHLETHPKEQVIRALVALAVKSQSEKDDEEQPQTTHTAITERIRSPCISKSEPQVSVCEEETQKIGFITQPQQNVVIYKRQNAMVYQANSCTRTSTVLPATVGEIDQNGLRSMAFPSLQIFSIPNQTDVLPPPPAYGTAISQLRSQSSQSSSIISNQSSTRDSMQSPLNFSSKTVVQRPSPSPSVLRFAESPVAAHYVEQNNGDFVVQETPRHVVECIEKDDGEFAVTEKLIRSPPTVLQFNDYEIDETPQTYAEDFSEDVMTDGESSENPASLSTTSERKSISGVTVLSDVKLDPNESLDLMGDIMGSNTNTKVIKVIWKEVVEEEEGEEEEEDKSAHNEEEANEKEEKNEAVNELKTDEILNEPEEVKSPENESQTPTTCTTSVIRMAINVQPSKNSCSISSPPEKPKKPKAWEQSFTKPPFKKCPKKLVVKFKNKPPQTDVDKSEEPKNDESPNSSSSLGSSSLLSSAAEIDVSRVEMTTSEVVQEEKENKQSSSIEEPFVEPEEQKEHQMVKKKEEIVEDSKHEELSNVFFDSCSNESPPDKFEVSVVEENDTPAFTTPSVCHIEEIPRIKVEIVNSSLLPMVVHESSLHDEIPTEKNSHEYESVLSEEIPENKNLEFAKLCWTADESEANRIFAFPDPNDKNVSSSVETIPNFHKPSAAEGRSNSNTGTFYPSTSQMSQPSTSSFAFEDQMDYKYQTNYSEYPFSFLYAQEKNRLSPVCSENEQRWSRYSVFTTQGQIQLTEIECEKDNYVDLEPFKRASSNEIIPLSSALNIRTDEKMPAKGEISEQESNGDIENSWSQPLCRESAFQVSTNYDTVVTKGSWVLCNEDAVYPKDTNMEIKPKFCFGPPFETEFKPSESVDTKVEEAVGCPSENIEAKPPGQKKRVRSNDAPRKKQFQCLHCSEKFGFLKERSLHLIEKHGYKRINRKIVREVPSSTVTTNEIQSSGGALDEDIKPSIESIDLDLSVDPKHRFVRTKFDSIRAGVYRMLMNFNLSVLQEKTKVEPDTELFNSKYFVCFTCKAEFITVKSFDEHLQEHPAECYTCSRKFTRWTYLSLHLKRHLGWKDFACSVCNKKFVIRSAMIEHMRMHTGCAPLKCTVCEKKFKRYSNLAQHKKVCHKTKKSSKKEYVCHCGEVLPSKARFAWHKETHDKKPKCCPYCRDRFVHVNSLKRHIRLTHSDKFQYTQPVQCPMCNGMYSKASLKIHMATHTMDAQHECPICNKTFSTKWNLKIHSWVHANRTAKPFKCDLCVKAFVREHDYKNHLNSHNHIRPYTCEYCGCKFIRKYNYMRHRREHHGQKKFKCDLCHKLFHRHYYLIEHRRTHTGERPFLCTICGKSSTTKTNHNKHLKIHHSRDPFVAEA